MFQGFTEEAVDFLWGIRFNNERGWFEPRKEIYLQALVRPMKELGAELYDTVSAERPDSGLLLRVTRIYRDARRLHGRGPYKDSLWFTIDRPGERGVSRPGIWFELTPEGWGCGLGWYRPQPVALAKLRARIDRDPAPMEKLTRGLRAQEEFALMTEDYRRPRAQSPTQELAPWYRVRSFSIQHRQPVSEELYSRELVAHLERDFRFLLPYYDYFASLEGDPDPREAN